MAAAADQATQLLRRVLQSAAGDEQARVDALIALGQRTLFAALWPGQDKYIRTLTNPAGETAMPLFTGRDVLEASATDLGWREPDGTLSWRELGAREAVRHALARGAHFIVVDLGTPHAIDFKREEMEPLLNRRATGGPSAQDMALTAAVRSASQPAGHRSSFVPPPPDAQSEPPPAAEVPPAAPVPAAPMPAADDDGGFAAATPEDVMSIRAPQPPDAQSDPPPAFAAPEPAPPPPPPPSFVTISPEPQDESFAVSESMQPPSLSPPVTAFDKPAQAAVTPGAQAAAATGGDAPPQSDDNAQAQAQAPAATDEADGADGSPDKGPADTAAQFAATADAARDTLAAGAGAARAAAADLAARFRRSPESGETDMAGAARDKLSAGAGAARAAATGLAARLMRKQEGAGAQPEPEPSPAPATPAADLGLSDDALDAIGDKLRQYPEVEWACCMPVGEGAPEIGLRIDPSFTARADEICGAMAAAAAATNETPTINVLDTLEKARTVRQQGTVFFPGRRRARPKG